MPGSMQRSYSGRQQEPCIKTRQHQIKPDTERVLKHSPPLPPWGVASWSLSTSKVRTSSGGQWHLRLLTRSATCRHKYHKMVLGMHQTPTENSACNGANGVCGEFCIGDSRASPIVQLQQQSCPLCWGSAHPWLDTMHCSASAGMPRVLAGRRDEALLAQQLHMLYL